MSWNPSKSKSPTADALVELLEKAPFDKITGIQITRLVKGEAFDLGWSLREDSDTPSSIAAEISRACSEDSEEVGGRFKYRATVRGMKSPGRGKAEEETTLFIHTWDMGKGDPSETGGHQMLKEAATFVKAQGEAGEKLAHSAKSMAETQNKVLEAQGTYMTQLLDMGEKRNGMSAHHVRMFELQMQENEKLRERNDERAENDAQREAEDAASQRTHATLTVFGAKVGQLADLALPTLLPALIAKLQADAFAKQVETLIKAKAAGINVPGQPEAEQPKAEPKAEEPAEPMKPKNSKSRKTKGSTEARVTQICPMAAELDGILSEVTDDDWKEIEAVTGENIIELLVAAAVADDDNKCRAILMGIQQYVGPMSKAKKNKIVVTLQHKLGLQALALHNLFNRIGLKLE